MQLSPVAPGLERAPAVAPSRAARPGLGRLTVPEAAVLGAIAVAGVTAWVALALADLGHFSLGAVVALALLAGALGTVVVLRVGGRPRLQPDPAGLAIALAGAVLAALLFLPGFPYAADDLDPGLYVAMGIGIARTGSWAFDDELVQRASASPGVVTASFPSGLIHRFPVPGSAPPPHLFPGLRLRQPAAGTPYTQAVGQFYDLYPAALAVAYSLAGATGVFNVNPLLAVLAVLAVGLAVRRVFGAVAGGLSALLLASNMIEVWQAKMPSSEIVVQMLLAGALLALVVALETRWRPAAGLAGLLIGLTWLDRADGILLVLLAVVAGCLLFAAGRFDGRCRWFAAGLAVVVPHALLQAYRLDGVYSLGNGVPKLTTVVAGVSVLVLAAIGARPLLAHHPLHRLAPAHLNAQRLVGLLLCAAALGLLVLGFLRPWLFGLTYQVVGGSAGSNPIPTYKEESIRWLAWFFTPLGFALALVGLGVVALRRWRAAAWALVAPVLLLLPVYGYDPRNDPPLMWWVRRFAPAVVPGVIVLIAVGLVWTLTRGGRFATVTRVVGAALAAYLVVTFLAQSLPLQRFQDMAPSYSVATRLASASGRAQGVYLLENDPCCYSAAWMWGPALWLEHGEMSGLLPRRPTTAFVSAVHKDLPGHPLFVVADGNALPAGLDTARFSLAAHIDVPLTLWEQSVTERPRRPAQVWIDETLWRLRGT